jgi:hypothetical protein
MQGKWRDKLTLPKDLFLVLQDLELALAVFRSPISMMQSGDTPISSWHLLIIKSMMAELKGLMKEAKSVSGQNFVRMLRWSLKQRFGNLVKPDLDDPDYVEYKIIELLDPATSTFGRRIWIQSPFLISSLILRWI